MMRGMGGGRKSQAMAMKFEVEFCVKSMAGLPSKYKHLRMSLTRGAKAVSTQEIFAMNSTAEPSAEEGTMKSFVCTMYRSAIGASFDEKKYRLSLLRINARALREKEKRIGSVSINLADYVRPDSTSSSEEIVVRMAVPGEDAAAVISLSVASRCYNGADGDAMSDISGLNMDTSSVTSIASLNSIEEDRESAGGEIIRGSSLSPEPSGVSSPGQTSPRKSVLPTVAEPTASNGSTDQDESASLRPGGLLEAKEELQQVRERLAATARELSARDAALAQKDEDLRVALADVETLRRDLAGAMKIQGELVAENERAERLYEGLLEEVEEGAGTDEAHVAQVGALREEAARLKAERDRARADHAELGARLEASESEAMRLAAAVNTELEAERARGQSCEKRLAAATARQGELEAELARAQVRLNAPKGAVGNGGAAGKRKGVTQEELEEVAGELERVSMQLVTASLGHAQAEQERLEAKQQVYQLKESNRILKERLTQAEAQLALAVGGGFS